MSAAIDYLATIQVIKRNRAGLNNALAGNLRAWLLVTKNPDGDCWGFSLILDVF
jgi:hypothetical protein